MDGLRAVVLTAAVALASVGLTGSSLAQETTVGTSVIDDAAEALASDPVYVHPDADPGLSESDADRLRDRIADADVGPVYIAVLPEEARSEAGGSTDEVLRMVGQGVGRSGTYAVVVGSELRAGATEGTPFEPGTVPQAAEEAVRAEGGEEPAAVLFAFVNRLEEAAHGGGGGGGGGGSGGIGILPILVLVGAGALFVSWRRRRQRETEEQHQLEQVRQLALDDLVALGDDLRTLDLDVEMPDADPAAKRDYVRALECYERASAGLDRARRPDDLEPVTSALEEGRYAMASAKARLEGREPPERRPPCFFDPRHGPSERDVEWTPPGGAPRMVPACAEDARRVERGAEPLSREVMVDGRMVPYWSSPYAYGPWFGGYFGGFGLLEGMLIGSMLGGAFDHDAVGAGDFDSGGFGGGFGGGDFGGGGFGGGDFGGGDFGGGDFGGGD